MKRWGASFVKKIYKLFVTNSYIKSFHNQVELAYFERLRINRLDRLVFVLIKNVLDCFAEVSDRIIANLGRMGPI
jgi:hypothetical protein